MLPLAAKKKIWEERESEETFPPSGLFLIFFGKKGKEKGLDGELAKQPSQRKGEIKRVFF